MAHGTPRRCPITVIPETRKMSRIAYKTMDHIIRTSWGRGGVGQAVEDAFRDTLIYGTAFYRIVGDERTYVRAESIRNPHKAL